MALADDGRIFDFNPPYMIVGATVVLTIADVIGFVSRLFKILVVKKEELERKNQSCMVISGPMKSKKLLTGLVNSAGILFFSNATIAWANIPIVVSLFGIDECPDS